MSTGARTLIVGIDGATWDVIDPLMAAGRMPNLARLVKEGARAPLNSTTPPMTLPSWSSMLTGTNPGKHGIFDFVQRIQAHASGNPSIEAFMSRYMIQSQKQKAEFEQAIATIRERTRDLLCSLVATE